jgi:hypothetical protein
MALNLSIERRSRAVNQGIGTAKNLGAIFAWAEANADRLRLSEAWPPLKHLKRHGSRSHSKTCQLLINRRFPPIAPHNDRKRLVAAES